MESDSTYKAKIGGKGVGRFPWLKAFEKVEIQSVYKEYNDKFLQWSFCFRKYSKEISDANKSACLITLHTGKLLLIYFQQVLGK